jgi:Putative peptidoglycan binding domain
VSPTDPPLPPSPDEPTEEPLWAGGEPGEPPVAGEPDRPDESGTDSGTGEPVEQGEVAEEPALPPEPAPIGEEVTEVLPTTGDVLPPTGDQPTEPIPPSGDEPTELLPPTGDEPTEVLVGAAAVSDGTGETTREHRRRVSHRRYVMRRVGVGLVTLAIVGGGVALLVALLGDDDDGAAGTDTTTPVTSESVVAAASTTLATTTTAGPETTEAATSATTPAVETSEEASGADPETTAPDETDPPEQNAPTGDGSNTTLASESSPPGTVVYDLDVEASCEIGQTLRRGDAGPQVECLQERLNEVTVGGEDYVVDGAFGEQTETAVRAFQQANQLGVDGIVGPATGELLGIWPG